MGIASPVNQKTKLVLGIVMRIAVLMLLLAAGMFASGCDGFPLLASADNASVLEARLATLVNAKRVAAGLGELKTANRCQRLAREHSRQMAQMACLTHLGDSDLTVEKRADRFGIDWQVIGENVARNRGYGDPVAKAVEDWLNSPRHKENMLSPRFTQTGVGVAVGTDGYTYITQVFLLPAPE